MARLALGHVMEVADEERRDVVSAVMITRALADDIRAARRLAELRQIRRGPNVVRLRALQPA